MAGVAASVALVLVYVVVLALANSLEHAGSEFKRLWFWMVPIVSGFGAQIALFVYARSAARAKHAAGAKGVVASGTASTVSMIACCAHHLAEVLPVVGLAGAAAVLSTYQSLFLLVGVLSNVLGLLYMLSFMKKHGLLPQRLSTLKPWRGSDVSLHHCTDHRGGHGGMPDERQQLPAGHE